MENNTNNYKIKKNDCRLAIKGLNEILKEIGLEKEASFFVYGSYFGKWRDGLSDLDAIIFFNQLPINLYLTGKVKSFQSAVKKLYEKLPFTKYESFFDHVFILDKFHATDGRFFIFDKEKIDSFRSKEKDGLVFGQPFLDKVRAVSLRHEQEMELAMGLHSLRNYLFFEIPKGGTFETLSKAKSILKYFRILPRRVSIINGGEMNSSPDVFKQYNYLNDIDYSPFLTLWENTNDFDKLEFFIKQWYIPGNTIFKDCLECFEKTLVKMVQNTPMLSRY